MKMRHMRNMRRGHSSSSGDHDSSCTLFQNLSSFFCTDPSGGIPLRDLEIRGEGGNEEDATGTATRGFGSHRLLLASLSPGMLKPVLLEQSFWDEPSLILIPGVKTQDLERFLSSLLTPDEEEDPVDLAEMGQLFHSPPLLSPPSSSSSPHSSSWSCPHSLSCGKSFSSGRLLRRHVSSFHDPSGNPHACPRCPFRGCRSKSELVIHLRRHTQEKPHACGRCDKRFAQTGHLNEHVSNVHASSDASSTGAHICHLCGLLLGSRAAVKRHVRIHDPPDPILDEEGEEQEREEEEEGDLPEDAPEEEGILKKQGSSSTRQRYRCRQCDKVLCSSYSLKLHEAHHEGLRPHKCEECGKTFTQKSHLRVHGRGHRGLKTHMCCKCGMRFATPSNLKRHRMNHDKEEEAFAHVEQQRREQQQQKEEELNINTDDYHPLDSQQSLPTSQSLTIPDSHSVLQSEELNLIEATDLGPVDLMSSQNLSDAVVGSVATTKTSHIMCHECGEAFEGTAQLEKHAKKLHQASSGMSGKDQIHRLHRCLLCPVPDQGMMTFATKKELRSHEREFHMHDVDSKDSQFPCPVCSRPNPSRSALEKHLLVHSGSRPHECTVCGKNFVQKSHVNHHMRTVHAKPEDLKRRHRTHFCLHCGLSFLTAATLQKHTRTHTNDRPFKCNFCAKAFIQKAHLQAHVLRHTGERPYLCVTCGKSFVTKANLKEHARVHTGDRRIFYCTQAGCAAQYASMADLKIHFRKHSGEMPYPCGQCLKRFRAQRHLDDHMRTHSGVRPFQCGNCHKTFSAAGALRQHFKRNDTCQLAATPGAFVMKQATAATVPVAATLDQDEQGAISGPSHHTAGDIIMFGGEKDEDEETVLVGFESALVQPGSGSGMEDVVADLGITGEDDVSSAGAILMTGEVAFGDHENAGPH